MNCYSLLHQLLDKQRNLDKLLIIKIETEELSSLVKTIADASDAGAGQLEAFAEEDSSIRLDQHDLPPGEVATRAAIAHTNTRELLEPFNPDFEFKLLLTQSEALSYAWHLAKVAEDHESRPDRAHFLESLGDEMKLLHHQTISLMLSRLAVSRRGSTPQSHPHDSSVNFETTQPSVAAPRVAAPT